MNILATYPNDYSMDDYREYVQEVAADAGLMFNHSMLTDEGYIDFLERQQSFDYDDFCYELDTQLKKTKIKQGFLEINNGGWQRQHGMTPMFEVETYEVLSKLFDCGEATIKMYKEGHNLGFIRYSHDEPTGATITLHSGRDFEQVENEVFA